jgi:hypothetical protein
MCPELVQSMLFFDQALNVIKDRLIFDLILHENLLQRGCGRYEYVLIVRPRQPSVNRFSGPSADERNQIHALQPHIPGAWQPAPSRAPFKKRTTVA